MGRRAHTTATERTLHDQTNILPWGKLIVVFITLSITLLITFIDQNGISVMLPTVAADLDARDTISWAGTASLIANTTFQMLYGRLSDIFGRKAVYLGAVAILVLADLLCGLVRSAPAFYALRGLAGVGGGGITNLSMIIVSDVVTLEQRGRYQGIIGATVGLGNVAGPFLAAAFIEAAGTWRAFFYLLAPLGLIAGVISFFLLPSQPPKGGMCENLAKIDYMGSFTSSAAVMLLLIPISGGGSYFQWNSPMVISMLAIGSCSLIAFIFVEWKLAKLPMMPCRTNDTLTSVAVSIFNKQAVVAMLVQSFLLGSVYQSYLYYLPMYLQNARGFSPIMSAAIAVALVGMQTLASVLSGQYISFKKRYGEVIWLGFGLWTLGAGMALLYSRTSSPGVIVIPLLVIGFGVGCVFQPILVALQAHSLKAHRAVIISNRNFFRCAGGACGLAVSAAVLQATLRAKLPSQYAHLAKDTYSLPEDLPSEAMASVLGAYMAASRAVFIMQVPLIGVCFLGCALIKDRGLEPPEDEDEKTAVDDANGTSEKISSVGSGNLLKDSDNNEAGYDRPRRTGRCEKEKASA
ncbi:hypothetical protein jhhlp_000804 [Lomentospora prolificans]|uniref:Major facilitator superfamily (MFS) profile domain-containing protein n=1 Tax=Lomentospora prolificans TaxID=41688 RepID=A0A2N3NJH2_9PEZI|nr:hypothetical protein jhhlp_000804 [Lomentospora prolificans]